MFQIVDGNVMADVKLVLLHPLRRLLDRAALAPMLQSIVQKQPFAETGTQGIDHYDLPVRIFLF